MRKIALIIAAGATLLSVGVVAAPAQATTSGNCGDKQICIYDDVSYNQNTNGSYAAYDGYTQNSYFGSFSNRTSSWKNRTNNSVFKLVDDPGFNYDGGTLDTRNPNTNNANLGANGDKAERAVFVRAV